MAVIAALWLALAAPAAPAPADDPLAPAWAGQVQCYGPDVERKTCVSIGSYERGPGGVIANAAVVLMASQPQIVMRTVAPVVVKGGAVCGTIVAGDLEKATFTVDGQPASDADAESIRKGIEPAYAQVLNRELCSTFVPDGEALKATVMIDGRRVPQLDLPVRWISPEDGFEVRP